MTDLADVFAAASHSFDERVRAVPAEAWNRPTPCADWSVRDLMNHLVNEQLWVPSLLHGSTIEDVGDRFDGDVLGADPVAAWASAAQPAVTAWQTLGDFNQPVHLSFGDTPAHEYAEQMILDLTVHGWDLARGAGLDDRLDDGLVDYVLDYVEPRKDTFASTGLFAAARTPTSDDPQERLLALLGR